MRPSHHTMAIAMFWREWVMRLLREMVAYAAFALTPHPEAQTWGCTVAGVLGRYRS